MDRGAWQDTVHGVAKSRTRPSEFTIPQEGFPGGASGKESAYNAGSERVSEVAQSCPTLCDPVDCIPPVSSVHGILQARILEWVAISFSRDLPDPGMEPRSPTLQADTLTSEPLSNFLSKFKFSV